MNVSDAGGRGRTGALVGRCGAGSVGVRIGIGRENVDLSEAIKAIEVTENMVIFIDQEQIDPQVLIRCDHLRKPGVWVVGVVGPPNIEAMTVHQLQEIIDRKREQGQIAHPAEV